MNVALRYGRHMNVALRYGRPTVVAVGERMSASNRPARCLV